MAFDLVIRGGTVADGSGAAGFTADVGVKDGLIAEIGRIAERGAEEIDADGLVVSPGFVDGHSHMDAQIHWDPLGTCACYHGVTTSIMGNCGFSIAPSREGQREFVVRNLERAEDISPKAMSAGIKWSWETFPDYLGVIDALPKGINYASNVGHSALRTWAMGERAFEHEATEDELAMMEGQLKSALEAGAIGFTTSRSAAHETADDRPVASRAASWEEIRRLVDIMGKRGKGVFELAQEALALSPDPAVRAESNGRLQALAVETGVPITFGIIAGPMEPEIWRDALRMMEGAAARGGKMFGQSHARGITIMMSFLSQLPFDSLPEWRALRAKPVPEQLRLLRDPSVRASLVHAAHHGDYARAIGAQAHKPTWDDLYLYDNILPPYQSVGKLAAELGVDPVELMIDRAVESEFRQFFFQYLGTPPKPEQLLEIMRHPQTVMTFSDTGAHVSQISDAGLQMFLLSYWARERGDFTLEEAVRRVTSAPAAAWGIADRGLVRQGMAADLNVFDYKALTPSLPRVVHDLPGGDRRLISHTDGILATIVAGRATMREGRHTGELPGELLRC